MSRISAILFSAAVLCGCGTEPHGPPTQLTTLPRDLTTEEARVSAAANQFALTLFKRLNQAEPTSNVFASPLSVTFSLGMAMNGASGATFDEMRSTLGFGADGLAAINAGYRGLLSLESGLDPSTTFQIANSVWHRATLPVMATFTDSMRAVFSADVKSAPFDANTVTAVNSWVSQKTAGKIPTILDQITGADVMFLINAMYFKGSWRERFEKSKTVSGAFAALGGDQQVPMMWRPEAGKIRYGAAAAMTIGELTYGNGAFVMTIVIPKGDINTFAVSLDTATWESALKTMSEVSGFAVELPKFTLAYERELKDDLVALGMQTPFVDGGADFSNMSPVGKQLFIGFVKHKTFVDVNEEGTEAAAVTVTGIRPTSAGPTCFCVHGPFIFAIRERFSGTILFLGKIVRIP